MHAVHDQLSICCTLHVVWHFGAMCSVAVCQYVQCGEVCSVTVYVVCSLAVWQCVQCVRQCGMCGLWQCCVVGSGGAACQCDGASTDLGNRSCSPQAHAHQSTPQHTHASHDQRKASRHHMLQQTHTQTTPVGNESRCPDTSTFHAVHEAHLRSCCH